MALFSQKTLDFLTENRLMNDRAWFEEHKKDYTDHVLAPLVSLTEALTPTLHAIDPQLICSPKVDGSISRIWRDARFTKDKSLFRDVCWCMFIRKKNVGLPEFFFVIFPNSFIYGCGYYSAAASSMTSMRKLLLSGDADYKKARKAYEKQNIFSVDGDMYKKSRHPDAPDDLKNWLDRKTICFLRNSEDFGFLFSENLASEVAEGYKLLAPVYNFLLKAEGLK